MAGFGRQMDAAAIHLDAALAFEVKISWRRSDASSDLLTPAWDQVFPNRRQAFRRPKFQVTVFGVVTGW